MRQLAFRWLPAFVWAALIFYLSSIPHLEVTSEPVGNFLTRKTGHLIEYAVLYLLIFRAFGYRNTLKALILATLFGISDETHQFFTPSRTPLMTDVLFDLAGASIGAVIWKYLPTHLKKLRL